MTDRKSKSLPPLVNGLTYGHLTVTIDEVLWTRKYPNEIVVLLQWWGENDTVSLRPADISRYPESKKDNTSITYTIQTNLTLFQNYLKQCNKLKLLVINDLTKEIVGHVEVNNLHSLVTGVPYRKYFSIITSSGNIIGDLRVDFDLSMNSVSEETSSKKMRRRSRRKNKSTLSTFRSVDEEEKSKPIKKGCKTCTDHSKLGKSSLKELPKSPENGKDFLNTERSDASDSVLLKVLEKGKKLRDTMVLSVLEDLEDSDVDLDEELLLKFDQTEKGSAMSYKPMKVQKSGEVVTPREEKLISDYLEGKAMKEEEEILVLNTLHGEDREIKAETKTSESDSKKQDVCCLSVKPSCPHSTSSGRSQGVNDTVTTRTVSCVDDSSNGLLRKVNCFRLTIDSLTLTTAGWNRISQVVDNKNKNCDVPPPGATYFVEVQLVEESPRSQAQLWKSSPLRFCSRRQIEDVVYFNQSSAQTLPPAPHTVAEALATARCTVCWRHLGQRVPARLGDFSLTGVLRGGVEATVTIPVSCDSACVAHVKLTLQLGRDKLLYGQALADEADDFCENAKSGKKLNEEIRANDEVLLDVRDPYSRTRTHEVDNKSQNETGASRGRKVKRNSLPNYEDIPVCASCGLNFILTNIPDSLLCPSCSDLLGQHESLYAESNFKISIPRNFSSREQRHHEFLLGIDTVVGFPLLAGLQEELSCYVDYRFPEITSGLKAELAKSETTSRVVTCEPQPSFSSVHRHSLPLPVVLPLSPLLANCCPGVTLRLWLRYYKPSPRDHMVAMALLPMDELCLMELEFDKKQTKSSVIKVLELPLALVPSSVTAPYQQYRSLGVLRVSVTYSNIISKAEGDRNTYTLPDTQSLEPDRCSSPDGGPRGKLSTRDEKDFEEDLRIAKNRFWTGPFGNENFEREINNKENLEEIKKPNGLQSDPLSNAPEDFNKIGCPQRNSQPVMKEDFDILAESLEQRFNQLQSDLLKERQKGLTEVDKILMSSRKYNSSVDDVNDDPFSFRPLSSNSSMESLPFILGPPADFKDLQNTVVYSKNQKPSSDSLSEKSASDTISGFFKEENSVGNLGSNQSFDGEGKKLEVVKSKTFKARIKVDRAVNLKGVKAPANGRKGKVPPSSWVTFGTGDCCGQSCAAECCGPQFSTPVVHRNYNPIWNLSWDIDLPVDYLQQADKRLVFRVFEENLNTALGSASAQLGILTSGLPCLSSWLGIDDLAGTCKGQLKIVVTPLEDLSQYQESSVFDGEEDEFEEAKVEVPEAAKEAATFVASKTEVFLNTGGGEGVVRAGGGGDGPGAEDDPFSVDDVISDYKNTLENNFRNEMAGLENLIKFLRVGSMNEPSFLRNTENKENQSSNMTFQHDELELTSRPPADDTRKVASDQSVSVEVRETRNSRTLVDASTETSQVSGEDVIARLLQQISVQLPTVKITDNTCQTTSPEMREMFTETVELEERTVEMRDASTETDDVAVRSTHICEELGSALLQHFLTCRPPAVRMADGWSQTVGSDRASTVDSSGVFMSGMSSQILQDNIELALPRTNSERLALIDHNIQDLERIFKETLLLENNSSSSNSNPHSICGSVESFRAGFPNVTSRELLDRESPSCVPDKPDLSSTDSSGTTLKRRGTYVIKNSKDSCEEATSMKESIDNEV
uniref:C2CD3 N-terminal C2 domain-containing protein n=3 Tax=Graphocephala atropunctata TaxID=36148 RepID=A0A1B6ME70_9HEMI